MDRGRGRGSDSCPCGLSSWRRNRPGRAPTRAHSRSAGNDCAAMRSTTAAAWPRAAASPSCSGRAPRWLAPRACARMLPARPPVRRRVAGGVPQRGPPGSWPTRRAGGTRRSGRDSHRPVGPAPSAQLQERRVVPHRGGRRAPIETIVTEMKAGRGEGQPDRQAGGPCSDFFRLAILRAIWTGRVEIPTD